MNLTTLVSTLTWLLTPGALESAVQTDIQAALRFVQDFPGGGTQGIAELVEPPYTLEPHLVQTSDGYILSVYRLSKAPKPGSQQATPGAGTGEGRPAVLLQHGLLDSCAGFLLQGPGHALGFLLVDAGFDVWLANSRGSTQSRRHAWLDVNSPAFWAFSFDEMAQYDLPETLAYVRAVTGQERVAFVSHSQGGTIALAALASQKLPVEHMGLMVLMAPVAMATHVTSIPLVAMSALGTDRLFTMLGVREFLPSVRMVSWLEGQLCTIRPELCISILAAICGYGRNMVNVTRLPIMLRYTPAGSSVQNMAHWAQIVRGGASPGHPSLAHFDWGTECGPYTRCNQVEYGSLDAPLYLLPAISRDARLFIFSGGSDRLADPLDTELLLEALPGGVLAGHQADEDLEHLDYIWGIDAPDRIYRRIISMFKNATRDPRFGGAGSPAGNAGRPAARPGSAAHISAGTGTRGRKSRSARRSART